MAKVNPKQAPEPQGPVRSIFMLVNVSAALADGDLKRSFYMVDDGLREGSRYEGTPQLRTAVDAHNLVFWNVQPVDPEAYVRIHAIDFDDPNYHPCSSETDAGVSEFASFYLKLPAGVVEPSTYSVTLELGEPGCRMTWGGRGTGEERPALVKDVGENEHA